MAQIYESRRLLVRTDWLLSNLRSQKPFFFHRKRTNIFLHGSHRQTDAAYKGQTEQKKAAHKDGAKNRPDFFFIPRGLARERQRKKKSAEFLLRFFLSPCALALSWGTKNTGAKTGLAGEGYEGSVTSVRISSSTFYYCESEPWQSVSSNKMRYSCTFSDDGSWGHSTLWRQTVAVNDHW